MQPPTDSLRTRFPLIHSLSTTRLRLTLVGIALLFVATSYTRYANVLATADGLSTQLGPMIGGDFVVFRTGAMAADTSQMVSYYKIENFAKEVRDRYPGFESKMFAWPYPPQMFLLARPLASLPFVPGYFLWEGVFLTVFALAIWSIWPDRFALFFALASPAVLLAIITGQTGLLTGGMIALVAANAERRPLLVGLAAGLLTVKPQFGILLPVALAARGCWRAFGAAAVGALAVSLAAFVAYGAGVWHAFFDELFLHGSLLKQGAGFPVGKLNTPFAAAAVLGAPTGVASAVQLAATGLLAAYVFLAWRRIAAMELRLAALATAVALATPYGFYYEMPILLPAMLMVAKHAQRTGWLKGERLSLILIWGASLLPPGSDHIPSVPVSFLVALAAFAIAARRVIPALGAPPGVGIMASLRPA